MATTNNMTSGLSVHRSWEDIVTMILGALIVVSPMFVGAAFTTPMALSAVIAGALIIVVGGMELLNLRRWEEIATLILGLWVLASPYIFAYTGNLRTAHVVLGALVALLAAFELWQDRDRTFES